jgi:hypothetical protein
MRCKELGKDHVDSTAHRIYMLDMSKYKIERACRMTSMLYMRHAGDIFATSYCKPPCLFAGGSTLAVTVTVLLGLVV